MSNDTMQLHLRVLATDLDHLDPCTALVRAGLRELRENGDHRIRLGSYVEDGRTITVGHSSAKDMEEVFKGNLLCAVECAFLEDALMGAALADKT